MLKLLNIVSLVLTPGPHLTSHKSTEQENQPFVQLRPVFPAFATHLHVSMRFRIRFIGGTDSINIRPIFQAYARGYPPKIWPYMVQYLHFRILEFPLNVEQNPKSGHAQAVRKLVQCIGYCGWLQNPSHQLIDGKHHIILFGFITVYPTKRMVETVETLNPVGCNVMFTIYQLIIRIMEKQHYGYGHGMDMSSIFTGHVPYLCEITKCVQDVFFSRCFRTIIPGFQCFYQ